MTAPLKFAFIGAHGTGKTTVMEAMAELIRAEFSGRRLATVSEVARQCPLPINQETTPETQQLLYCQQVAAEILAAREADVVLCDRAALDYIVYTLRAAAVADDPSRWEWRWSLWEHCDSWLRTYDRLWWLRPTFPLVGDVVRSDDRAFQTQIDGYFTTAIEIAGLKDVEFCPWPAGGLEVVWPEVRQLIRERLAA